MAFNAASCSVSDALAFLQNDAVFQSILGRYTALTRLAELLDQAGSSFHIPDLSGVSQLLPVSGVDLGFFNNLAASCPSMGLQPGGLGDFQSQVRDAYMRMASYLGNHPWNRMNSIQGLMDDAISKAGSVNMRNYMDCIDALCSAFNRGGQFYNKISGITSKQVFEDTAAKWKKFTDPITQGGMGGKVLTAEQEAKTSYVNSLKEQFRTLAMT